MIHSNLHNKEKEWKIVEEALEDSYSMIYHYTRTGLLVEAVGVALAGVAVAVRVAAAVSEVEQHQ